MHNDQKKVLAKGKQSNW